MTMVAIRCNLGCYCGDFICRSMGAIDCVNACKLSRKKSVIAKKILERGPKFLLSRCQDLNIVEVPRRQKITEFSRSPGNAPLCRVVRFNVSFLRQLLW